jgi:hypothetical protein
MHQAARRRGSLLDGRPKDPEFDSSHKQWFFPTPSSIDQLAVGHIQPPNQWVSVGGLSFGGKSDQKRQPYYHINLVPKLRKGGVTSPAPIRLAGVVLD